jgi:hypothetical protein
MNRALEEASGDYLGDRVAGIMEKLGHPHDEAGESASAPAAHKPGKGKKN